MDNLMTGENMIAKNIYEVTKRTGISARTAKKLIETGSMSRTGWTLDEVEVAI